MGMVPKVAGKNCLQKLEFDFCDLIPRFGGSTKRLGAEIGFSFCGLSPAHPVKVSDNQVCKSEKMPNYL